MKIKREEKDGVIIEYGHTLDEYDELYGLDYENGDLWDFTKEDLFDGTIEPQKGMVYWSIKDENGNERLYETELEESCKVRKEDKEDLDEERLDEGTSNFGTGPDNFPLLVFYTIDEFYDMMRYAPDYPDYEDFQKEDEIGHFYYDDEAYEDAKDEFEQKYWDENDICVLDEDSQERLEDALYDFNKETERIADDKYDDANPDDYYNLKDVKVGIEPGYYEAAYIDVEHEDYLEDLSDGLREEQYKRFEDLFKKIKEEFGLTQLSAGPAASDGTRGYSIVKEDKEEPLEEKKKKDKGIIATGYDLGKSTKFMNHMLGSDTMTCEDYDDLDKYDLDSYIKDDEVCVYLFPEGTTQEDVDVAKEKYNLKYLGKVEDNQEDKVFIDIAIKGKYKDLKKFGEEHLGGYLMHPDFIWKEEEWEEMGPIPFEEDLNEGYVGQVVQDFLDVVIKPEDIETLVISNIDAEDYEEAFNGKYENLAPMFDILESEYVDFDVGGEKLVVDVSSDMNNYGDDYYETLGDLVEDYNGDEICVYDVDEDEYIFDGDKSELDEDTLDMRFISIETPKYLCVNAHCGDNELGIGDIDDIIDDARDDFDEAKEKVNPSEVIPEDEQKALAKGELIEESKKFALVVNGEWYSTFDSFEKANEARERMQDACSNEDDARGYYGECPNIDIKEISDEELKESHEVEKDFSKKDINAMIDWWKKLYNLGKYNIDIGDGKFEDVEGWHAAMFDMLDDLSKEDTEEAKELFNNGKKLYNKYALSKYNESLKEDKEQLHENKILDKLADDIDALLKKEGIPSPYIDITNDECVDVGASDEEHLAKIKEVLTNNDYSFEDISGGYPKYFGVRVEYDAGPNHGYASVEDYERSSEILDEMSALRKEEERQGNALLKAWAIDRTMSSEEFNEKNDKLTKEIQDKINALYNELHELTLKAEESRKDESLKEDNEIARVEYCVMDELNNNIECFDNSEDAIAFAKDNEGVRVLEVKYGPKDEHGDEDELSCEEVWSIRESLDETIKDGKPYFYIKFWEDEERRDQGESDIFMQEFETKEEAIKQARKLVDRDGFASVEVFYTPKGDVKENDDELVFGYDGVEVWKESLNEDVDIHVSSDEVTIKDDSGEDIAIIPVEQEATNESISFRRYDEMNEKMSKFLLDEGLSQEEVDTLKSDNGLQGNALHQKIIDLGLKEKFFNDKKECVVETYKAWSIKTDPLKEEVTILVKNKDNVWEEFAQVENCPTKDMLEEDIVKTYSPLVHKALKEHNCKIIKEEKQYCIHVKVKDSNGKVVKEEDLTPCGTKKEMEEKKKQLEDVSPEDSHHNRNFYSLKQL